MWLFKDFTGENNVDAPSEIQDNELAEVVNFYVNNVRHLAPREGFTKVISTPAPVVGLCYYNGVLYYALANGKVYAYSGSVTEIGTHANSGAVRFLPALGKIFIADGVELKYYDGTTYAPVNTLLFHEEVIGVGDGNQRTFNGVLSRLPVTPQNVTVIAGNLTGNDDGRGNIFGSGFSGTINYATGEVSLVFATAPANGVAVKVRYTASDVVDVRASLIAFKQDKLYCAYRDRIYYMRTARDLSAWDFVGIDTQAGGDITALHVFYTDLIIGKGKKIYRLSFADDVPVVSLLASNLSLTQDTSVAVKGDILFASDEKVHTLRTTMEWGDIKVYSLNPKFKIGSVSRLMPTKHFIIGYGTPKSFIFNPTVEAFTTFTSHLRFRSHYFDGVDLYVGTDNAILKYGGSILDDAAPVNKIVKFKEINAGTKRAVVTQVVITVNKSVSDLPGTMTLFVKKGRIGTQHLVRNINIPSASEWDKGEWDEAYWAGPSTLKIRLRQVITDYSLQFLISTTALDSIQSLYVEGGFVNG